MSSDLIAVEETLSQLGQFLMKVDMFPVFFTAHFVIACLIVREDSKDIGPDFRRNHPFASWFCTLITGLAGVFVANFLFGEPLIQPLKDGRILGFVTVLWYFVNYSPFDVVHKIAIFPPVFLIASTLQECLRVRFIYLGILEAAKAYPGAHMIILLGGVIKGNGYGFIKIVERLVRGKWTPATNEILDVTYFAKSGLYASLLFVLHYFGFLSVPIELLYLGVIVAFVVFRMIVAVGKVKDPLLIVESPICSFLFGSGSEDKVDVNVDKKRK